jgi:hypothetical protein
MNAERIKEAKKALQEAQRKAALAARAEQTGRQKQPATGTLPKLKMMYVRRKVVVLQLFIWILGIWRDKRDVADPKASSFKKLAEGNHIILR